MANNIINPLTIMEENLNEQDFKIYALLTGSGIGTKPLQSFLDSHMEIITIPGYPLVYFYPHCNHWKKMLDEWSWENIIMNPGISAHEVPHGSLFPLLRMAPQVCGAAQMLPL